MQLLPQSEKIQKHFCYFLKDTVPEPLSFISILKLGTCYIVLAMGSSFGPGKQNSVFIFSIAGVEKEEKMVSHLL